MKKKLIPIVVICAVLLVTAYIAWNQGWLNRSPSAVFKESLSQANRGNYAEASQNLPTGQRRQMESPEAAQIVWDRITRQRTIRSVKVTKEDRGVTNTFGDIEFTISYADGTSISGQEKIIFKDGSWRHGIEDLLKIVDEDAHAVVPLSKEYQRTGEILIRLPQDSILDKRLHYFKHPVFYFEIHPGGASIGDEAFEDSLQTAEKLSVKWDVSEGKPAPRRDLSREGFKAVLLEGDTTKDRPQARRYMILVIGAGRQAQTVIAFCAKHEALITSVRESLTTAQWSLRKTD